MEEWILGEVVVDPVEDGAGIDVAGGGDGRLVLHQLAELGLGGDEEGADSLHAGLDCSVS